MPTFHSSQCRNIYFSQSKIYVKTISGPNIFLLDREIYMLEGNVGASLHYIAILFQMCTHFLHAKGMVSDQSLQ